MAGLRIYFSRKQRVFNTTVFGCFLAIFLGYRLTILLIFGEKVFLLIRLYLIWKYFISLIANWELLGRFSHLFLTKRAGFQNPYFCLFFAFCLGHTILVILWGVVPFRQDFLSGRPIQRKYTKKCIFKQKSIHYNYNRTVATVVFLFKKKCKLLLLHKNKTKQYQNNNNFLL